MKRAYAETRLGQIHYYEHGRGEVVLMLHETPRSAKSFEPLMQRLGSRYRCVAPDNPGFGMSDPLPADTSMERLADTMVEVMDALGIERVHLIGFHTGNKVAAALAARHPHRVGGVVLIGMTHSMVISRKARNAAIMEIVRRHFGGFEETSDGAHRLRTWGADFGALAALWWKPAMLGAATIDDATLAGQEHRVIESIQCRRAIRKIYAMNFDFDFSATLRRVKAPALVIECCVPEELHLGRQGEKMVSIMRSAKLLSIDNAGFDATDAHAGKIARACATFFKGL
jgi:pimeloyl-ACP methyl ester carboxylesterase